MLTVQEKASVRHAQGRRQKTATRPLRVRAIAQRERPFHYRNFCRTYAVNGETLSRLTGAAPRTVAYWQSGKEPQRSSRQKLVGLSRLFAALSEIIQPKAIGSWLNRSNPAFADSTPLQVIERGEADRVWRMIWELREGHSG